MSLGEVGKSVVSWWWQQIELFLSHHEGHRCGHGGETGCQKMLGGLEQLKSNVSWQHHIIFIRRADMCKNVHTVEYNAVHNTQKKSKERDT